MKTIIITGGTSGIGLELVKYFIKQNYQVIFTGRKEEKALEILSLYPHQSLHFFRTDFASFDSVQQTAQAIKNQFANIDTLVNNAGVWEMNFKETKDGIETNFAVNHLSTMLFTLLLLENINPQNGRIINTSSGAHRRNILDFEDMEWRKKPYDGVATYSQSKLCNILFTHRLSRELESSGITVNTVHPGYVKTGLFNNMGSRGWDHVPEAFHGARSAIFAAESDDIAQQSNGYIYQEGYDQNISSMAQNENLADALWDLSLKYLENHLTSPPI
jgi:NAD(P)-dependent dehydrogenase (short-subunit alcohol dehydrogenase family)